MMVCLCHGLSERRIRREIEHGATTIEELAAKCGAGSCCLGCHPTLDALLSEPAVAVATPRPRLRLA